MRVIEERGSSIFEKASRRKREASRPRMSEEPSMLTGLAPRGEIKLYVGGWND